MVEGTMGISIKEYNEMKVEIERLRTERLAFATESEERRAALSALVADIEEYERVNNFAPSPGKRDCWQSVTRAKALLGDVQQTPAPGTPEFTEAVMDAFRQETRKAVERAKAVGVAVAGVQTPRTKVVGRVTGRIHEGDQVPGMPHAICHACGLKDYPCTNPDCPNVQTPPKKPRRDRSDPEGGIPGRQL